MASERGDTAERLLRESWSSPTADVRALPGGARAHAVRAVRAIRPLSNTRPSLRDRQAKLCVAGAWCLGTPGEEA